MNPDQAPTKTDRKQNGINPDIAALEGSFERFMRYFLVHVNPILHRATYLGRSYSEYEIITIMALGLVGPMRPADLSQGLAIEKGTLTTIIRRLTDCGHLERRPVSGDRRSYQVALTSDGKALRRYLDTQRRQQFQALFADMAGPDLTAAAHGIDLLTAYLQTKEEANVR